MTIEELEFAKTAMRSLRDSYFLWLLICTGIVFLGVLIEEAENLPFIKKHWFDQRVGIPRPRYKLEHSLRRLARIGWIMIFAGVLGEGVFEALVSYKDGELQATNDAIMRTLGDITAKARADAESASNNAQAASNTADSAKLAAADANVLATGAKQDAGEIKSGLDSATRELATLKSDSKELSEKADRIKADLVDFAVCNSPRVISNWMSGGKTTADPLKAMAGQKVIIEFVPD